MLPLRVAVALKHMYRQKILLPDILAHEASIPLSPCCGMSMASGMVTPDLVKQRNAI